jgi:hypothetical protein
MKVMALFDEGGKVHALFHPSSAPDAPALQFRAASGQRVETLDIPPELQSLSPAQLHAAVVVDLSSGTPMLARRAK